MRVKLRELIQKLGKKIGTIIIVFSGWFGKIWGMNELREWLVAIGTMGATIIAIILAYQNREIVQLSRETVKTNEAMVKANQEMVRASLPPLVDLWLEKNTIFARTVTDVMELSVDVWQFLVDSHTGRVAISISGPIDPRPDLEKTRRTYKNLTPNTIISKDLTEDAENILKGKKILVEAPKGDVRGNPKDLEPFLIFIASYRDAKTKAFHRECKIIRVSVLENGKTFLWPSDYLTISPWKELIGNIKAELPCL